MKIYPHKYRGKPLPINKIETKEDFLEIYEKYSDKTILWIAKKVQCSYGSLLSLFSEYVPENNSKRYKRIKKEQNDYYFERSIEGISSGVSILETANDLGVNYKVLLNLIKKRLDKEGRTLKTYGNTVVDYGDGTRDCRVCGKKMKICYYENGGRAGDPIPMCKDCNPKARTKDFYID